MAYELNQCFAQMYNDFKQTVVTACIVRIWTVWYLGTLWHNYRRAQIKTVSRNDRAVTRSKSVTFRFVHWSLATFITYNKEQPVTLRFVHGSLVPCYLAYVIRSVMPCYSESCCVFNYQVTCRTRVDGSGQGRQLLANILKLYCQLKGCEFGNQQLTV